MRNKILIIISGFLLIAAFFISMPDGKARVIFCDVGQGDGAIILQSRTQMLIDVGPENKKMVECLGRYLPFWDKKLEVVVLTHNDRDHVGGLAEVEKHYQIEQKYSSADLRENDVIRFGEIRFEVVSPAIIRQGGPAGLDNENSVVGVLKYEEKRILFTGDATKEVEQRLVWRGVLRQGYGTLNVLKVAHHGSAEGTSEELLELIRPEMAVISVGKNNKFGHPAREVVERLERFGVEIRRTDAEGDIVMVL